MKQTSILVLGMHRSGTSALTGVLNLLDVYLGSELMKKNSANEKGYFENNHLYKINEELLSDCQSSWDDIFYTEDKLIKIRNIDKLKSAIKYEFEYSKIFAIKDPRLAYLFPIYEKVLKELDVDIKVILPYRNPVEVARSLKVRDDMSMEKGMLLWAYHFLLAEKYSRGHDRVFMGYDDLMDKTEDTINLISEKLNISLSDKYSKNRHKVSEFLDSNLKHHNISIDNLSKNTPPIVKKILSFRDRFNEKTVFEEFDDLREELFGYQKLFYNNEIFSLVEGLGDAKSIIAGNDQLLAQKDEVLTKTKEALAQKERVLKLSEESLKRKEAELSQAGEALSKYEREIKAKDERLRQAELALQEKERALAQQDEALAEAKKSLAQRERELKLSEEGLKQKGAELTRAKEALSKYEGEIKAKDERLQQVEAALQEKERAMAQKDKVLSETKEVLRQKDQLLIQKDETIVQLNDEVEALKDELVIFYEDSQCMLSKAIKKIKGIVK